MSRTQKNRPDIQKLRHEVELQREEIKTLTQRVKETLEFNDAHLNQFILKAKELIYKEREEAVKTLRTFQNTKKSFIRRFMGWFRM